MKANNNHPPHKRPVYIMRVATIPPVMALLLLTLLYWLRPEIFAGGRDYWLSVLFLCLLPVLAYPLQPLAPGFKGKGREGQRNLAIVTAMIGYIASLVYALCARVSPGLWLVYLTYALSGLGIALFNRLLRIRASGHACGTAGPLFMLVYYFGPIALSGLPVLGIAFYASLQMRRHNLSQLLWGTAIPLASMLCGLLILRACGA